MKYSKFSDVRRSAPLNPRLYSVAAEVRAAVNEIVADIVESGGVYKRPPSKKSGLVASVELLVLNFLRLRYSDPKRLLAAGFRKSDYASGTVSYLHMRRARDGMMTIGLMDRAKKHYFNAKIGEGTRARYRATARLVQICGKHQVRPSMIRVKERRVLIQLRGRKAANGEARTVPWPRAAKDAQKAMTSNLRRINQALRESMVALHVSDATLDQIQIDLGHRDGHIDFFDKDLYRVFNDGNPRLGGRFFGGWWQNVPSEYRKFIHIIQPGTWATYSREIDYSGMQPRILYAQQGLDGGSDLYTISKYDGAVNMAARDVVKMMLLQMLNAVSEDKALDAAKLEIIKNYDDEWYREHPSQKRPKMTVEEMLPKGCPPLQQLMADIKEQHQPIAAHFCSDAGKRLMYADSMIAEAVMLRMIEAGAVVLPVHDSFIVRHEFEGKLREVMHDEFCKFTGFDSPTKLDESELEAHKKSRGPLRTEARGYLQTNTKATEQKRREHSIYTTLKDDWMATDKRTHPKLMSKGIPNELYTAPFGRRSYSTRRKLTA